MIFRSALIIAFCLALNSCTHSVTEPKFVGNFPSNVSSIIEANCLGGNCHTGPTNYNTQFDLSSWDAMTKGSEYFNEIIPYSAVKSHFFGHVNTNANLAAVIQPTMPLARNPLSGEAQMALFNWINEGAKSADGNVPYIEVTKKIIVANESEDMLGVIDAASHRLIRIISVGIPGVKYQPTAVSMMPDGKSVLVGMSGNGGIIRKYDVSSYSSNGECSSNLVISQVAITPDGSKGYVTNDSYNGSTFGVFDPTSMTFTKKITTSLVIDPIGVVVAPDGKFTYMCGHRSDNILRIDTRTDSVVKSIPLGLDVEVPVTPAYANRSKYLPERVVVSADSKVMYVTCLNTSEVVVFNLLNDSIIARIPIPYSPWGASLSPDGSELWTASWGTNKVHIISTATNQVIASIDSVSQGPRGITFTPDGTTAYVACEFLVGGQHHHGTGGVPSSGVVEIDCKTRKKTSILELPGFSVDIATGYR